MKAKTSVLIVSPDNSRTRSALTLPGNAGMPFAATISGEDEALALVNTRHFDCVVIPGENNAATSGLARIIQIIRPDVPIFPHRLTGITGLNGTTGSS
ncbi:MAG: hypothetical protein HQK81_12615 [Desulfovibrionaceae bacterium]|nr:hypothetical protein [Desulfovibrionaceae bacterium]MBF0514886.1 hypothetical protein [Desulfovibrionaceae bacterium]